MRIGLKLAVCGCWLRKQTNPTLCQDVRGRPRRTTHPNAAAAPFIHNIKNCCQREARVHMVTEGWVASFYTKAAPYCGY